MTDTLTSLFLRLSGDRLGIWAVLVELILIGLCVNWSAAVLQGTRGTRPLRGVLIMLVVATLVVRAFGWARLELLYSYVLTALAFIGLVVFQPELRRAVIRAGDVRFRKSGQPQAQLVSALVKAAGYLSRNHYGALIAIQRHVDLTGWAENGTMIRAEVSANLLNTIFFPNSPLHDLGVIIRSNRVLAANCQFPSAEADEVNTALGSRHLAAVGMSYETDALVLVISEETGIISLADNGKLTRYLSLDDLSEELTQRLAGMPAKSEGAQRGISRRRLIETLARVAVVVPLTLVIWFIADQATLAQANVQLQLNVRHENPRYTVDVQGPRPSLLTATFSGPVCAIDRLETMPQPLEFTWDTKNPPGEYTLDSDQIRNIVAGIRESRVRGLAVRSVDLRELRIRIDDTVTLNARVQPDGEQVQIAVQDIEPPEVEVVVRRGDLPQIAADQEALIYARLGRLLEGVRPGEVESLNRVRLERQVQVPGVANPISVVRVNPEEVRVRVSVVGARRHIENIVVQLYVSPEVYERYRVERADLNEWRIEIDVEAAEATLARLSSASFDAFALVTPDMVPAPGEPDEGRLRTLDVTVLSKEPGVAVIGERTVRVNLVPRTAAPG